MARFEVAAHRYVDLSDNQSGIAVLNDCKYGYKLDGRCIDLSLLRSPVHPDPDADIGGQVFTYALLPQRDAAHSDSGRGAMLNQPPVAINGRRRACPATPALHARGEGSRWRCSRGRARGVPRCGVVETRAAARRAVPDSAAGAELVETDLME